MRRLSILIAAAAMTLGFWMPAQAQSAIQVVDVRGNFTFGEQFTISARVESPIPPQEVMVFFQAEGETETRIGLAELGAAGEAVFRYSMQQGAVRPFAQVIFWYRVTLENGEVYTSPQFAFEYIDNRFPWKNLEDAAVRVNWYAGEIDFGQSAFDVAHAGLQIVNNLIPVSLTEPVDIYIYSSSTDLQSALSLGGQSWVAGHASPDLGVVLVSIAPGPEQEIQMERQIPHELADVMLYRYTGPEYQQMPAWLREGIASRAELYPNPDYHRVLTIASESRSLIPMSELCAAFPPDASRAFLAYAEASSFTRYLHETYGASGLQALINAYADGLDCEQGAARALGTPLSQLDQRWRQVALGENATGVALQNLLPYLIILGGILVIPIWSTRAIEKEKTKDVAKATRE